MTPAELMVALHNEETPLKPTIEGESTDQVHDIREARQEVGSCS